MATPYHCSLIIFNLFVSFSLFYIFLPLLLNNLIPGAITLHTRDEYPVLSVRKHELWKFTQAI